VVRGMKGKGTTIHVAALLAAAFMIAGCSSSEPEIPFASGQSSSVRSFTYTVQPGDTLYRIALRNGLGVGRLMAANGISDPRDLRVGQSLVIPSANQAASIGSASASSSVHPYQGARADRQFDWPVSQGVVSSGFGMRNGAMHEGVDIAAPVGTPIHAADSGVVIFSGQLHGYGNTVIIRHDDSYVTVYGHNEANLVHEGDHVSRGQTIARMGQSGRTTGANVHFEVRCDNVARDPLAYLPQPEESDGIAFAGAGGS
jgi:murein DD-endopeptidase MepM/ murein hydrolase activator NlpD